MGQTRLYFTAACSESGAGSWCPQSSSSCVKRPAGALSLCLYSGWREMRPVGPPLSLEKVSPPRGRAFRYEVISVH